MSPQAFADMQGRLGPSTFGSKTHVQGLDASAHSPLTQNRTTLPSSVAS